VFTDPNALYIGITIPRPWCEKQGLTMRTRWVSPESLFATLFMDELGKTLGEAEANRVVLEIDTSADGLEPRFEIRYVKGTRMVPAATDTAVVDAIRATIQELTR
jgi:hypothetical protein